MYYLNVKNYYQIFKTLFDSFNYYYNTRIGFTLPTFFVLFSFQFINIKLTSCLQSIDTKY